MEHGQSSHDPRGQRRPPRAAKLHTDEQRNRKQIYFGDEKAQYRTDGRTQQDPSARPVWSGGAGMGMYPTSRRSDEYPAGCGRSTTAIMRPPVSAAADMQARILTSFVTAPTDIDPACWDGALRRIMTPGALSAGKDADLPTPTAQTARDMLVSWRRSWLLLLLAAVARVVNAFYLCQVVFVGWCVCACVR